MTDWPGLLGEPRMAKNKIIKVGYVTGSIKIHQFGLLRWMKLIVGCTEKVKASGNQFDQQNRYKTSKID